MAATGRIMQVRVVVVLARRLLIQRQIMLRTAVRDYPVQYLALLLFVEAAAARMVNMVVALLLVVVVVVVLVLPVIRAGTERQILVVVVVLGLAVMLGAATAAQALLS